MSTEAEREVAREKDKLLRAKNPQKLNERNARYVKEWRKRNPGKARAQKKIYYEIRAGRMRAGLCFCGRKGEAHHTDYRKSLEVMWLCRRHHAQIHREGKIVAISF